jgi:hypothetical protein
MTETKLLCSHVSIYIFVATAEGIRNNDAKQNMEVLVVTGSFFAAGGLQGKKQ